jgi:hypothetical protein
MAGARASGLVVSDGPEHRVELLELAAHGAADLVAELEVGGVADRVGDPDIGAAPLGCDNGPTRAFIFDATAWFPRRCAS